MFLNIVFKGYKVEKKIPVDKAFNVNLQLTDTQTGNK